MRSWLALLVPKFKEVIFRIEMGWLGGESSSVPFQDGARSARLRNSYS